jgi:hypothetical protein
LVAGDVDDVLEALISETNKFTDEQISLRAVEDFFCRNGGPVTTTRSTSPLL